MKPPVWMQDHNANGKVENRPLYAGPWTVGCQWFTGLGPRTHDFGNGDYFTRLLQQHGHIAEVRSAIRSQLAAECASCDNTPLQDNPGYDLGGLQGVPKYIRDY